MFQRVQVNAVSLNNNELPGNHKLINLTTLIRKQANYGKSQQLQNKTIKLSVQKRILAFKFN